MACDFNFGHAMIFFTGIVGGGVQLGPLCTAATNRTTEPVIGDYNDGEIGGMIGRGNRNTRKKNCSSVALSTTNPAFCPDANPGLRGSCSDNTVTYSMGNYRRVFL
jgi:hypothetical protein